MGEVAAVGLEGTDRDGWERTLARVVPAVVEIRVSAVRPFDTQNAGVAVATGFVVDAKRGLILTNRHVVQPGPVVAEAIFLNHERATIHPLYRDPVHDFGLYRFDPADVRFMDVVELPLAPGAAHVGAEVRLVGNDAGEKLSILDGTLARLDREAPAYGRGRYNDFNTFYLQAASASSGGSSGSPVVDQRGRVVGLNAGGKLTSASSFFLPLDRVQRALRLIQSGKPVTRGTLQTTFLHRPYDELGRLGLRETTEARFRRAFPGAIGMLVVDQVLPGGPADGMLEPGDVLLSVDGRDVTGFAQLEGRLDEAVGSEVALSLERGGVPIDARLRVGDLHAITPDAYVMTGGAIVHPLSYQVARAFSLPVKGVFLASRGYSFARAGVPPHVVITEVDGEPVPDLAAFESIWARKADGERVSVRWFQVQNPRNPGVSVVQVDRRWYPMRHCTRNDAVGLWDCVEPDAAPAAPAAQPATASLATTGPKPLRRLARSIAAVDFDVPFLINGVQGMMFSGAGLVVDAERGLVVVDRDTVPIPLGDLELTFGGAVRVAGEVVALHPEHNLALVRYDPAMLGDTPVEAVQLEPRELVPGDSLHLIALTPSDQLISRRTEVSRVGAPAIPLPRAPRFRETNIELVEVTQVADSVGGALADGKGRVVAFWASFSRDIGGKPGSFFAGLPASAIAEWVEPFRAGETRPWRSRGAEREVLTLAGARARGLPEDLARGLEAHDPERRRVLAVRRVPTDTPAVDALVVGDLLVAIDGHPVTRFAEVERAARLAEGPLEVRVVRDGVALDRAVPVFEPESGGISRVLAWAGALLHEPPREIVTQRGRERTGVYVAGRFAGSPAQRARLAGTYRILAVDGTATPDLDAFLAATSGRADRDSLRLRVIDLEGRIDVLTLELDLHYWHTYELERGPAGWVRSALQ